jgi:hypothetical protein
MRKPHMPTVRHKSFRPMFSRPKPVRRLDAINQPHATLELLEGRTLLSSMNFLVTNVGDTGPGSLRQAILDANANAGQDTISFAIPASAGNTINVPSALPTISDPIIIDGTTEASGAAAGQPLIILNGAGAVLGTDGLDLTAGDNSIIGLAIEKFSGAGIRITGLGNNTIQSSYIGTDPTGAVAGNNEGLVVQTNGNYIGTPGHGNVISGNTVNGVHISAPAAGSPVSANTISSNFIGTNASGTAALGNSIGILLDNVSNTLVNANVVSGNSQDGIQLINSAAGGNVVTANHVGVDTTGTLAVSNFGNGVSVINSTGALIGGAGANGNIISGNFGDGVSISNSSLLTVAGNSIGTDASGTILTDSAANSFANFGSGVDLQAGSHDNTIGGVAPAARNVIAGSFGSGVWVHTGASAANLIQGNFIGTDANATLALGSQGNGVTVASPGATFIGNTVGNNQGNGFQLGAAATLQGNFIGTQIDGITPLANIGDGVNVTSSGSLIGTTGADPGNVIAFNGANGINIVSGTQNAIRGNSIYSNTKLGIDLGNDGVTPNATAPRTGANNLQNHPDLVSAQVIGGTSMTVSGTLTGSLYTTTYTIDIFSNSGLDNTTPATVQGRTFLGSIQVTTDASGNCTFSAPGLAAPSNNQPFITATATDPAGNTSEFSAAVMTSVGAPQATTQTTLSTSNGNPMVGQMVLLTANVTVVGGGRLNGNVTFQYQDANGVHVLGTSSVSNAGVATLSTSFASTGTYNVVAVYGNDPVLPPSSSDPVVETVKTDKVSIYGTTFRDITGDGLTSEDPALAGVTVNLYRDVNGNGKLDSGDGAPVAQMVSDSNGNYSFTGLTAARYFVQEVTPSMYIRTAPALSSYYTLNAPAGSTYTHQDFDNYMTCNDRQWVSGIAYSVNGSNTWISDLRGHIHEGDNVKVRFTVARSHTATLTLVSYTAPGSSFDASVAYKQTAYQFATGNFTAGLHTMQVNIPKCFFQVDFVCGDYIDRFGPAGSNIFYSAQNRLISADNGGIHTQLLSLLGAQDMSIWNT